MTALLLTCWLLASVAPVDAADAPSITGTLTFTTNYLFRGLAQNGGRAAIQGGFDHAARDGFHVGIWGSNVSGDLYAGGSMEFDVLAGYAKTGKSVSYDVGLARYGYPDAASAGPSPERYDTTEFFFTATCKRASIKYSHALTDWFGVCDNNPFNLAGTPNGSSKGSGYLELSLTFPLEKDLSVSLHAGHQNIRNYGDASYTDYGLKFAKTLRQGFEIDLLFSNTDADTALYTIGGDDIGASQVALSVTRSF